MSAALAVVTCSPASHDTFYNHSVQPASLPAAWAGDGGVAFWGGRRPAGHQPPHQAAHTLRVGALLPPCAGDLVELKLSVPENKRRVTVFRGVCIARRNRSVRTTFTLRNIYGAAGGIERTFPL